jgi:hypothetical protein
MFVERWCAFVESLAADANAELPEPRWKESSFDVLVAASVKV